MTILEDDIPRPHEAHQTGAGQAARHAAHAHNLLRDALKRELEAEIRGLLMAARMHGFYVGIVGGKPVVTEAP